MQRAVQFTTGVPTLSVFRDGGGSPLVIDLLTSTGYYANPLTGVISAVAGSGGGGGLTPIANGTVLSNISGSSAVPIGNTLSAILDAVVGSTQGQILTRNAGTWTVLGPGALGTVLTSGGAGANLGWAAASAGGIAFTYASTPPVSPNAGDLWIDNTSGIRYEYVNDGNSSQWVEF